MGLLTLSVGLLIVRLAAAFLNCSHPTKLDNEVRDLKQQTEPVNMNYCLKYMLKDGHQNFM